MTPIGESVGVQISKKKKLITVLLTGFVMGVIITVSEPDLQVLASQVPSVPNAVLILTVALGVGFFLALAIIRIRYKIGLSVLLIICYAALMLGLGSIDKSVLISMVPKNLSEVLMDKLRSELRLHAANSGIAFTIPLNGATNLIFRIRTQGTEKEVPGIKGKEESRMSETKYSLVAAIVNRGFSGDVMETVRAAGAKGGTVIHSRRIGDKDATSFWGLSVQDEKEIVLILTESVNKVALMKCIGESCGMHSEAQGIVMSLPIDSVAGI